MTEDSWKRLECDVEETHPSTNFLPIDSSKIYSKASKKGHSKTINTETIKEFRAKLHPLRSIYLGSDRRYNNYWIFLGLCNANDPGHRRVYFESSEDCHWEVIDTPQALCALLSALDHRCSRESHLFASLEAREAVQCLAMDHYMDVKIRSRQIKGSDPSDVDHYSGDGSSPISDIDNILPSKSITSSFVASGAIVV